MRSSPAHPAISIASERRFSLRPPARAVALTTISAAAILVTASLSTPQALGLLLVLVGLAGAIVFRNSPVPALGLVSFLALCSGPTLEVASVNVRVEQPAVLILAAHGILVHRGAWVGLGRRHALAVVGLGTWVGAAAVASVVVAPEPVSSLRIVIWLGLSMLAGATAASLAVRIQDPERVATVLVMAGGAQVGIALLAVATGRTLGIDWGGYGWLGLAYGFRASALAWEPNIFASGIATLVPVAIAAFVANGRGKALVLVAVLAMGVWLGLTRTVFVALAVGLGALVAIVAVRNRSNVATWVPRLTASAAAVLLGVAVGAALTATSTTLDRGLLAQRTPIGEDSVLPPPPTGTPGPTVGPSPTPTLAPTHTPGPSPSTSGGPTAPPPIPIDMGDPTNLEFRLVRLRQAIADVTTSPLIGLGANSFGQRHGDPSQAFRADYLGMLPMTVIYDSGVLGFGGFALFFLVLLLRLWTWRHVLFSAAFLAALAVMLGSYVMTDALRLGFSWVVIGCAVGLAQRAWETNQPEHIR